MTSSTSDSIVFAEQGILHRKGALSKNEVQTVKDAINSELVRLKLRIKGQISSSKIQGLPIFQQTGRLGQMVNVGSGLDRLFPAELVSSMNFLAKTRLKPSRPQLLLSVPHKQKWSLNNLYWHLDIAVPKHNEIPGVQAFILIDDVQPRGGATLAIAGSHQLPYLPQAKTGSANSILRQDKLFSGLFDERPVEPETYFKPHAIHGIQVSVVEMSGKAGDTYLMDMRLLHSPSINASKNVRMMATNRFMRDD
jgi:hypothetical protein